MTQHLRKLKDVAPLHMVVVLEAALNADALSALLVQIGLLKRRFGLAVSGVASGLEALGADGLQFLHSNAVFDSLYFSGDPAWLVADGLTAARRTSHSAHLFVTAQSLLSDPMPSLRLLVELLGSPYDALCVRGLSALYCDQSKLGTVIRPRAAESWESWVARAWKQLQISAKTPCELGGQWSFRSRADPTAVGSFPPRLELYVSRNGLTRFGGWSRMRQQAICFGEHAIDEFGIAVAINNDAQQLSLSPEPEPGVATLCGWFPLPGQPGGGQGYLFDVVPAPVWSDATCDSTASQDATPVKRGSVALPRQVLQVRLCRMPPAVDELPPRLVFVMSNFEKGALIPAAMYGVAMQTHANVALRFTDDASSDESVGQAEQFKSLLAEGQDFLGIHINAVNRGTYWIRNEAIYCAEDPDSVFLVNDSDDVSALQRGTLQSRILQENPNLSACFMDVVRVDTQYTPLSLEAEVERYGTASLAFRKALVDKIGYFENIKRNADTEFIERVRLLRGNDALQRYRYPCLYQVFDGHNLTADIYTQILGGSEIRADHSARALHTLLFRQRHRHLTAKNASSQYRFPESSIPVEYRALGTHFLLAGYEFPDAIAVVMQASEGVCKKIAARGAIVVQIPAGARSWKNGTVRLFDSRGVLFSANLGAQTAIEYLIQELRFTGYLMLVHDAASLDAAVRPGALLPQFGQYVICSKKVADQQNINISELVPAIAYMRPEGIEGIAKWANSPTITTVIMHTVSMSGAVIR